MDAKTAAVGVALLSGLIVIGANIPPVATVEVKVGYDYLGRMPDGGATYLARHRLADGGEQWLRLSQPGCVRRPDGGSALLCRRGTTLSNRDFGEANRFPASEAQPVINNCEPVPCAVFFGETPDLGENTLLGSTLGEVLP